MSRTHDHLLLRGFVRSEDEELVKTGKLFFYHAVEKDCSQVAADPAAHDTRVLVPYRPGKWLGWWAMIKKRELVHRDTLAARLRTKPERHEALYYYLLELEDPLPFETAPTARPPFIAGAPSPCSWGDLHSSLGR